jgi:NAD dependent epimerase/dehydratase family enzyme
MTRVVVAGASGFMGRRLVAARRRAGEDVRTIGRSGADAAWGDTAAITRLLDGADLLVNLAGRSVNCRYTPANRVEIVRSRVETTAELARAVAAADVPPPLWINSSTATIYRHADDRPMTEAGGELGEGFSVDVARAWERAFFEPELPGVRRVALRTAIVLGRGSVMIPLTRLTRLGLGGPQLDGRWPGTPSRTAAGVHHRYRPTAARGRQRFSWVHLDDVVDAIEFLRAHPELDGAVNLAAPEASDDRTLMRLLRRALGVPVGLPATRWMLELGSFAIRTETELVLKSRWVVPERLLDAGFVFRHADLEAALRGILRR